MTPFRETPCAREAGIALVLTLSMLVIATILVVGFVSSMRVERQVAASVAGNTYATFIAQAAVDHAVSILDQNIPQPRVARPSPTVIPYPEYTQFGGSGVSDVSAVNWVTQPGLLTTIARHTFTATDTIREVPLSSNPTVGYTSTVEDANLNPPLLNGGGHVLRAGSEPMRVAWLPVLRDPTASAGANNEIVGRYGFWIDDESTKANINTAYGKPSVISPNALTPATINVNGSIYPLGHPSSVDLDIFGGIDRAALATAVRDRGGILAVEDVKGFAGDPVGFYDLNKFDLTAHSRAPEFNVFGKPKLYFMRGGTSQLGFPIFQFFRDRHAPPYFPVEDTTSGADRHASYYAAESIASYFLRTDWPGTPADPAIPGEGLSFVKKWDRDASGAAYPGLGANEMGRREADQVAWNLLSFGSFAAGDFAGLPPSHVSGRYRDLANRVPAGEPGFVSMNRPNTDAIAGALSGKAMLPAAPIPLVNEVCLAISPESYALKDGTQRYRLHVLLNTELWLPPGYPPFDFEQAQTTVGLTYLRYEATQALPGTANAVQEDAKYVDISPAPNDNGIRKLWMRDNSPGVMQPGEYRTLTTTLPFYIRNGTGFSDAQIGAQDFETSGQITLKFRMRLYAATQQRTGGTNYGTKHTSQLIPVWDRRDPATSAAPASWNPPPPTAPATSLQPPADDLNDYIEFQFDLDPASFSSGTLITRSLEVADPRNGGLARAWVPAGPFNTPSQQNVDTMSSTRVNNATTAAAYDTQKIAFVDLTRPAPASDRPSTGFLSFLPTGMQRGIAGSTPKFQPSGAAAILPDWLLLDLVAPNVTASNYGTMSYMNSTAGKVNLNSQVRPNAGEFALSPRFVPLQALLQNVRPASTTSGAAPPSAPSAVVDAITSHTLAGGGRDYGAPGLFDYEGEIAEIEGVGNTGSTDWERELILRNLASSMTTKSNVFSVWGVAQSVKKNPANSDPTKRGVFETKAGGSAANDVVTGEKRFQAIVERYVWAGADAAPGNAHVNGSGNYDSLSAGQSQPGKAPPYSGGTWEPLDGPDPPTYPITFPAPGSAGSWTAPGPAFAGTYIEESDNPTRALMKYRVLYFRYLNE